MSVEIAVEEISAQVAQGRVLRLGFCSLHDDAQIEPELRDTFMAEAAADDRPAAQVVRELMRDYISRRQPAREYDAYLRQKVEVARTQRDAGLHVSNEEMESEAAARRATLRRQAGKPGS